MFTFETRPTTCGERVFGHAACDRCGHILDEAHMHSGYHMLGMLRFQAGPGSRFGEGRYIEGDFCDACLFTLLARYVRATDNEWSHTTDIDNDPPSRHLCIADEIADALKAGFE